MDSLIDTIKKELASRFKQLEKFTDDKNFFETAAYLVEYIDNNPETRKLISELEAKKSLGRNNLESQLEVNDFGIFEKVEENSLAEAWRRLRFLYFFKHPKGKRFFYEKFSKDKDGVLSNRAPAFSSNLIPVDVRDDYRSHMTKIYHYLMEKLELEKLDESRLKTTGNALKSIHLVTPSIVVKDFIFMVLDSRFEMPFRFNTKKADKDTAIKKLHNIFYPADVPGKKVEYSKKTADNINNGIFKKRLVKKYIETNGINKPTLVQKSKDLLTSKNEVPIKIITLERVPLQYRQLYIDKTK